MEEKRLSFKGPLLKVHVLHACVGLQRQRHWLPAAPLAASFEQAASELASALKDGSGTPEVNRSSSLP